MRRTMCCRHVSFGRRIKANGYSFRTLAQPDMQHLDAVGFTVAVCAPKTSFPSLSSLLDCREEDWKVIASSRCLWTIYSLNCINVKDGLYDTSLVRSFHLTYMFNDV